MIRDVIDVPAIFMRAMAVDWRPDWRGQSAAVGTDGSEQVVFNRFPRFVGKPSLRLPREMLGEWRAIALKGMGRVNAYRMRMIDPMTVRMRGGDWRSDWLAYQAGLYQERRPQVVCALGASAGASSVVVDETSAPEPIRVGAYLSHGDWPFAVVSRSGPTNAVSLGVVMLRKAIPPGAAIDLVARGVFVAVADDVGFATYEHGAPTTGIDLDLQEWITR